ncbi:MAG: hypothetical protein WDN76_05545 [Alphaproteobacteria bacterium]
MARGNAKVLTVSHYSRSMLAQYGVAQLDRIAVIPNGVDHIKRIASENEVCQRLGLRPNTYAVALANTQAHKNIRVLLEAFALDALAETKLVLVGAGGRARLCHDWRKSPAECGLRRSRQRRLVARALRKRGVPRFSLDHGRLWAAAARSDVGRLPSGGGAMRCAAGGVRRRRILR